MKVNGSTFALQNGPAPEQEVHRGTRDKLGEPEGRGISILIEEELKRGVCSHEGY